MHQDQQNSAVSEIEQAIASKVDQVIETFADARVLVIGDTILDVYVYGTALGVAAETPTIVARELETRTFLGGAFAVARQLLALGARVELLTLVGDDDAAHHVTRFAHPNLKLVPVQEAGRATIVKKRYWVDGYKFLQLDQVDNRPLAKGFNDLMSMLDAQVAGNDLVVVADFRHGLLSPAAIDGILRSAHINDKPLYVDSQVAQSAANHHLYRGADVLCLNWTEARAIDATFAPSFGHLETLAGRLGIPNIVVKLGADGAIARIHGRPWRSAAPAVNAVDTCGAGDAFLSGFCLLGLSDPASALRIANSWAALSTTIHGNEPSTRQQLIDLLRAEWPRSPS